MQTMAQRLRKQRFQNLFKCDQREGRCRMENTKDGRFELSKLNPDLVSRSETYLRTALSKHHIRVVRVDI